MEDSSDPNNRVKLTGDHPCSKTYTDVYNNGNLEEDYCVLFTSILRHRHTESYCQPPGKKCRFKFPFDYSHNSYVEWELEAKGDRTYWVFRVVTKRNHHWAVSHSRLTAQVHRANADMKVIFDSKTHGDYCTKYATKIEELSNMTKDLLHHLQEIKSKNFSSVQGIIQSFSIKAAGNPAQYSHQVAHNLMSLSYAI